MDATKADLMRFGWMESAREEICHVEDMEQISQIGIGLDGFDTEKEANDCNGNIGKFTTWREKISRILEIAFESRRQVQISRILD